MRRTKPTGEQLLVLVDRAERGPLRPVEAGRLREGIAALVFARREAVLGRRQSETVRRALGRLHRPVLRGGVEVCVECSGWNGVRCLGLVTEWPCSTADVARLDELRRAA
ncbi:hypothetical protein [Streptomyces asiaticus]|uniref:hypothetical protein n=1 Tax=Streptomyces asiaticus TaxID=114695 RepID=UPI001BA5232E|nr:hypothetical protein [Streptomyces asiaticus]